MFSNLRPTLTLLAAFTIVTGIAYPLAMTEVAGAILPRQAGGSLIVRDGTAIGSSLIGQSFAGAGYFHPRPSAAGNGYDASASSGTNLAPTSAKLADRLKTDAAAYRAAGMTGPIPADAITTSGSGLDPHISPAFAQAQIPAVAKARGLPGTLVRDLVNAHIEGPELGFLGDPRVNVLQLNLALDDAAKSSGATPAAPGTSPAP
ncbi:potassium-transporting ATPase subunit C [Kaistia algarum]|uniref:potassium-transporting ATPase subunit KdpC n=1 Tax=Kaistia algarum TaxID=2083279 RepID=UPI000CE929A7|nr:potassium-transporting ATPase subunit KdpC [Kaistia algarum]MCX5514125.1 potassium-transporting ATPase subunit KdpC [Kaistia algarum]PPE77306.1 potassium-transporting ATPase subunit C [Kaistia algarum]